MKLTVCLAEARGKKKQGEDYQTWYPIIICVSSNSTAWKCLYFPLVYLHIHGFCTHTRTPTHTQASQNTQTHTFFVALQRRQRDASLRLLLLPVLVAQERHRGDREELRVWDYALIAPFQSVAHVTIARNVRRRARAQLWVESGEGRGRRDENEVTF